MRLEPGEVAGLPLPAALVDTAGVVAVSTPEWVGPCPGTLTYRAGAGHLLVAPDTPTPELDALMGRLLDEIEAAAARLGGDDGCQAAVLAAGLALVAGRPVGAEPSGTARDVLALTVAAVRARTRDLVVEIPEPVPEVMVPAPAALALALVQIAVNAREHEAARRVLLRVRQGPTFSVEWPAGPGSAGQVRTHRHALRRERWGRGYVQMVADALGGVALPPGPAGTDLDGACVGLGAIRLGLPVACVGDGRIERASQAWDEDPSLPALGQQAGAAVLQAAAAAASQPGLIAYYDVYRARLWRGRTWVVLAPEIGSNRVRDVLRGLHHERALWRAPEPHATRVSALTTLIEVAMGEPWPSVPPGVYAEVLPEACAALGVAPPEPVDALCLPDPRVAAFLLAEAGGRLVRHGDAVWLAAADPASTLLRALGGDAQRWLKITP